MTAGEAPAVAAEDPTSQPSESAAGDAAAGQATRPWPPALWWTRVVDRVPTGLAAPAMQGAWVLSGLLLGAAVGHVFRWGALSLLVLALLLGGLSWLGRGIATVLVAGVVTLAVVSLTLRLTMVVAPDESWSMRWLLPLSVLLLAGCVLCARRTTVEHPDGSRLAATLLDVAAGGGSLLLALFCSHRIASSSASSVLLSSEDNAAWMNMVGNLRDAHGLTHDTTPWVLLYGPVANTFAAFTREATGGLLSHRVPLTADPDVVLASHLLLLVLAPVVAALLARRTLRSCRPLLTLLTWAVSAGLGTTYLLITPDHGFLTAGLAILLVLAAAGIVPAALPSGWDGQLRGSAVGVRWLAGALLIYAAGASWIPLAPLGAAALVGWWLVVALPALRSGPARRLAVAGLALLATAAMCWSLFRQYQDVVNPIGGGDGLFQSTGGTPSATSTMTVLAAVLLLTSLIVHRGWATGARAAVPTLAIPLVWLLGYVAVTMVDEAYTTRDVPHYGTIKLLYVVVAVALLLGVVDLLASQLLARLRGDAAVCVVVAALFAATVEQGPVSAAALSHWPKPLPPTIWIKSVSREVKTPGRVLCLGLTAAQDVSQPSLDAYLCNRWAASLRGGDDETATTWRAVQINRQPVSAAVSLIKNAHDRPWRIVYIGSKAQLADPKAWYAPIVAQPGLTFVSSGF